MIGKVAGSGEPSAKVEDRRSRRVALVAHCILNQNAKVIGFSRYPAAQRDVVDMLLDAGFGLVQMPCPETYAAGINRWWQTVEQYRSPGFQRTFRRLARHVVDQAEDYLHHGYLVVLVGIDGSPSCGVHITSSNPKWGGCPHVDPDSGAFPEGEGAFIAAVQAEARRRGMGRIPAVGSPADLHREDVDNGGIRRFLMEIAPEAG